MNLRAVTGRNRYFPATEPSMSEHACLPLLCFCHVSLPELTPAGRSPCRVGSGRLAEKGELALTESAWGGRGGGRTADSIWAGR